MSSTTNNLRIPRAIRRFGRKVLKTVLVFVVLISQLGPYTYIAKPAEAANSIPKLLNYQARITNSAGVPVTDGNLNVWISVYDASSSGTCMYAMRGSCGTPSWKTVTVTGGVFSTLIGDTGAGDNAIPDALFDNNTLYLGITVASDTEMVPRKRITSAPYAFNADRLDDLDASSSGGTTAHIVAATANGNLAIAGDPQGAAVSAGSVYINPVGATANETLIGIADNGTNRWMIDKEGDITHVGSLLATAASSTAQFIFRGAASPSQNIFEVQDSATNRLLSVSATATTIDGGGSLIVGTTSTFIVNSSGNLTRINNVAYAWPGSQGAASTVLTNDGAGNLTWASAAANTTNLNQAYLNSTSTTEIYLTGSQGAVTIADTLSGTGNIFELQDRTNSAGDYSRRYFTVSATSTNLRSTFNGNVVAQSGLDVFTLTDGGGVLRTNLRSGGIQTWYLNDGAGAEVGRIGFATPTGVVGIALADSSGNGRSDFRHLGSAGGFSWAAHSGSGIPPELMRLDADGDLGIGTTSTTERLIVSQNQNGITRTLVSNTTDGTGAGSVLSLDASSGRGSLVVTAPSFTPSSPLLGDQLLLQAEAGLSNGIVIRSIAAAPIALATNNLTRMTLASGGNVGIGNTAPANLLTVGNATATFEVNAGGNIVRINSVPYSWPSTQGGASTVLQNNGSGVLSWVAAGSGATLQTAYDSSTGTTEIFLGSARGALTLADSFSSFNGNLFEIQDRTNGAGDYSQRFFTVSSTSTNLSYTALTNNTALSITGGGTNMVAGGKLIDAQLGNAAAGNGIVVTTSGAYTGTGLIDVNAGSALTTGKLLSLRSAAGGQTTTTFLDIAQTGVTGLFTGNLVNISSTATNGAARFLNIVADSSTIGIGAAISMTSLSTGTGLSITGGGANMGAGGELIDANMGAATAGNGIIVTTTGNYAGTGVMRVVADSMTTGAGTGLLVSANGMTSSTGNAMLITSSAAYTGANGLVRINTSGTGQTGPSLLVSAASTGAFANGGVRLNFTGAHTGNAFQIDDVTLSGNVASLSAPALTSGSVLFLNGGTEINQDGTIISATGTKRVASTTAGIGLFNLQANMSFSGSGFSEDSGAIAIQLNSISTSSAVRTVGYDLNITSNSFTSHTQRGYSANLFANSGSPTDNTWEALYYADNADTATGNQITVTSGYVAAVSCSAATCMTNGFAVSPTAGTITNGFAVTAAGGTVTNGLSFNGATTMTTDFVMQNGETIDNNTDGVINTSANTFQVSGASASIDSMIVTNAAQVAADLLFLNGSALIDQDGTLINATGTKRVGSTSADLGLITLFANMSYTGSGFNEDSSALAIKLNDIPGASANSITNGIDLAITSNSFTSHTQRGIRAELTANSGSPVDQTWENLLLLNNADTATGNLIAVTDALLITNSGAASGGIVNAITIGSGSQPITTALNLASTGITTDIRLQNGEVIHNDTDGTISFTDGTNVLCTIVDGGTTGSLSCTGGITASTSLNQAYNNSTSTTEIFLTPSLGALTIADTFSGTGNIFEIQDRTNAAGDFSRRYFTVSSTNTAIGSSSSTYAITPNARIAGNLTPTIDDTFDLGDYNRRWRDLWLGPGSLHVGTSETDEGFLTYDTTNNVFRINTDGTTNGDVSVLNDLIYVDKSSGAIGVGDGDGYLASTFSVYDTQNNNDNFVVYDDNLGNGAAIWARPFNVTAGRALYLQPTGAITSGQSILSSFEGSYTTGDPTVSGVANEFTRTITNGGASTITVTGALAAFSSVNGGATTFSADVVRISELETISSGTGLNVDYAGTGLVARFEDNGTAFDDDTTPFVIDATGRVGVGMAAPTSMVTIAAPTASPTSNILEVQNTSGGGGYSQRYLTISSTATTISGDLVVTGSCSGCGGGSTTLNQAYLNSTSTTELFITPSQGALSIADTFSGTGNIFEIQDRTNSAGDFSRRYFTVSSTATIASLAYEVTRTSTSGFASFTLNTGTTNQWSFQLRNDATNDLHIRDNINGRTAIFASQSTGNVGIGSIVPNARLTVLDGSASPTSNVLTVGNLNDSARYLTVSSTATLMGVNSAGVAVSGYEVGIGQATPTARLHVTPDVNTTALQVSGYSLTGSNASTLATLTGTWNTSGAPVGLFMNITDTSSSTNAQLMALQQSGVSRFTVGKTGSTTITLNNALPITGISALGLVNSDLSANNFSSIFFGDGLGAGSIISNQFLNHGVSNVSNVVFQTRDNAGTLATRLTVGATGTSVVGDFSFTGTCTSCGGSVTLNQAYLNSTSTTELFLTPSQGALTIADTVGDAIGNLLEIQNRTNSAGDYSARHFTVSPTATMMNNSVQISNPVTTANQYALYVEGGPVGTANGSIRFQGTNSSSHFYYGTNQDITLNPGQSAGSTYLNSTALNTGHVMIGGVNNVVGNARLTVIATSANTTNLFSVQNFNDSTRYLTVSSTSTNLTYPNSVASNDANFKLDADGNQNGIAMQINVPNIKTGFGLQINAATTTGLTGGSLFSLIGPTSSTTPLAGRGVVADVRMTGTLLLQNGAAFNENYSGISTGVGHNISLGDSFSTGAGLVISSRSSNISSAELLDVQRTVISSGSTGFTGNIVNIGNSHTVTSGTPHDTGSSLNATRSLVVSGSSFQISGPVANFSDDTTLNTGWIRHGANVVAITQNFAGATNTALAVVSSATGGGAAYVNGMFEPLTVAGNNPNPDYNLFQVQNTSAAGNGKAYTERYLTVSATGTTVNNLTVTGTCTGCGSSTTLNQAYNNSTSTTEIYVTPTQGALTIADTFSGIGNIFEIVDRTNSAGDYSRQYLTVSSTATRLNYNDNTTNDALTVFAGGLTTGTGIKISTANTLTTGFGLDIQGGAANSITTGGMFRVSTGSAAALSSGLVRIDANGAFTSSASSSGALALTANSTVSGVVQSIQANAMTTGTALGISTSAVYTGAAGVLNITANGATTGNVARIDATGLTSGSALTITGSAGTMLAGGTLISANMGASTAGSALAITNSGAYTGTTGLMRINTTATGQTGPSLQVSAVSTGAVLNGLVRFQFTGAHTNTGFQIDDSTTAGTAMTLNANSITTGAGSGLVVNANGMTSSTGNALRVSSTGAYTGANGLVQISSANAGVTGPLLNTTSNSTGAFANGGIRFQFTAAHTGNGVQIDDAGTTGNALDINATALTTGNGLNVTTSNNTGLVTAWSANKFNVTSAQATTASNDIAGVDVQFTQSATIAGNTEQILRLALAESSNTDAAVANGFIIRNDDTATNGQVTLTDGIEIVGANVTNGVNFSGVFGTNYITSNNFIVGQDGQIKAPGLDYLAVTGVLEIGFANATEVSLAGGAGNTGCTVFSSTGNLTCDGALQIDGSSVLGNASSTDSVSFAGSRIASNLTPTTDATFDLGDYNRRWRDLWLSGGSAHIAYDTSGTTSLNLGWSDTEGRRALLNSSSQPIQITPGGGLDGMYIDKFGRFGLGRDQLTNPTSNFPAFVEIESASSTLYGLKIITPASANTSNLIVVNSSNTITFNVDRFGTIYGNVGAHFKAALGDSNYVYENGSGGDSNMMRPRTGAASALSIMSVDNMTANDNLLNFYDNERDVLYTRFDRMGRLVFGATNTDPLALVTVASSTESGTRYFLDVRNLTSKNGDWSERYMTVSSTGTQVTNLVVTGTCTGCSGGSATLQTAYDSGTGTTGIFLGAAKGALTLADSFSSFGGNLFEIQDRTNGAGDYSRRYFTVSSTSTNLTYNTNTAQDAMTINATGMTTGFGQTINVNGSTTLTSGGGLRVVGPTGVSSLGTGGLVQITSTGNFTTTTDSGGLLRLNATGMTAATVASITDASAMTGNGRLLSLIADAATTATSLVPISANGLTTGTALAITSTGNVTTAGGSGRGTLLEISKTGTVTTGAFSGSIARISYTPTYTTTSTTNSGNALLVNRLISVTGASTQQIIGAAVSITDNVTQSAGTVNHGASTLEVAQNFASATGTALKVFSNAVNGRAAYIAGNVGLTVASNSPTPAGNIFEVQNYTTSLGDYSTRYLTVSSTGTTVTNLTVTGTCTGCGGGTLQSSYTASTDPEITLDSTRGALSLWDNATPIAQNLFEVVGTDLNSGDGGTRFFTVSSTSTTIGNNILRFPENSSVSSEIIVNGVGGTILHTTGNVDTITFSDVGSSQMSFGNMFQANFADSGFQTTSGNDFFTLSSGSARTSGSALLTLTDNGTPIAGSNMLELNGGTNAAGNGINLTMNSLTTGNGILVASSSTGLTSGSLLSLTSATTGAVATNGIVEFEATGNFTSSSNVGLLNLKANSTQAGTIANIQGNALTTGTALRIATTGSGMTSGTLLNVSAPNGTGALTNGLLRVETNSSFTSSASQTGLLSVYSQTSTNGTLVGIHGDNTQSGTLLHLSGEDLITGNAISVYSFPGVGIGMTTGHLLDFDGRYRHTTTNEVGSMAKILMRDISTVTSTSIGLLINPEFGSSSISGTRTLTGLKVEGSFAPSGANCGSTQPHSCAFNGVDVSTPALNVTAANTNATFTGLNLSSAGALGPSASGARQLWNGLRMAMPSASTASSGVASATGISIVGPVSVGSTDVHYSMIDVSTSTYSVSTGVDQAINLNMAFTSTSANNTGLYGINIKPQFNLFNTSAGTKAMIGMNVENPTYTQCVTGSGKRCGFYGAVLGGLGISQTHTSVDTLLYHGLDINQESNTFIQSGLAGTIEWRGIQMRTPNITQTTGTVTSTALEIIGGTVTSGTAYAITADTNAGNWGVGNTAPGSLLTVGSSSDFTVSSTGTVRVAGNVFVGNVSATDDDFLYFDAGTNNLRWVNTTDWFDFSNDLEINMTGTATANGTCHSNPNVAAAPGNDRQLVVCSGAPTDVAEMYPTVGVPAAGEILVATDATFTYDVDQLNPLTGEAAGYKASQTVSVLDKSSTAYAQRIIGVVSTSPAVNYGRDILKSTSNTAPVALVGRVPTKVSVENGPIAVGDPITTSSVSGVGMKSTKPSMIVGYALSAWNGPGQGTIQVYVQPDWHSGLTITTDGAKSLFNDDFTFKAKGTATSGTAFNSFGLNFRGSAWNGASNTAITRNISVLNETSDISNYQLAFRNDDNNLLASLNQAGDLAIAGSLTVEGGFDYAEMFPAVPDIEAGDIVMIDPEDANGYGVKKTTQKYENSAIGVISTKPGFLTGKKEEGSQPVALAGRVPVKVNMEGGEILPGDPITSSSTPGVGMKATEAGRVIGLALQGMAQDGTVMIFVNPSWWNGPMPIGGANTGGGLAIEENAILDFKNSILTNVAAIISTSGTWSITADGYLTAEKVEAKEVVTEKLKIKTVSDTPERTVGVGRIQGGYESTLITNSAVTADSLIVITFETNPGANWWIEEKQAGQFVVKLAQPAHIDQKFTYWIVPVDGTLDQAPPDEDASGSGTPETPPPTGSGSGTSETGSGSGTQETGSGSGTEETP